ncbi:MAG: ornithine cyclodeaminase family protein [Planctomycetes bacterium]|nr:ornithine cyclodeaminase family protein [Planctomycetota bacterium]
MLYLSADAVRRALPMREAIEAMRDAFAQLARGEVALPLRLRLDAPSDRGAALVMPSHSTSEKLFSLKMVSVFHDNPQRGLPTIQSVVILTDGSTGTHLAILEGASLTAIRTGAASGLATDLLARPDAAAAAIFGAGVQARTQLEALCAVRPIRRARVHDIEPALAERFAAEMTERLGIPVEPAATPAKNLEDADAVCTATPSCTPLFADSEVPPGAHINAVGAYRPDMVEVPAATVCRARVVVDHRASALEEAGDLIAPLRSGLIGEGHISAELGEIVLGRKTGRRAADEITLFKSVGVAIQDLCAAARALASARQLGLGTPIHS